MKCRYCDAEVPRDVAGLNKKLFEHETKKEMFMCISCMAASLECTIDDLYDKIKYFKAEDCKLFS